MNGRHLALLPLLALVCHPALSSILSRTHEEEAFLQWLRDPTSTHALRHALSTGAEKKPTRGKQIEDDVLCRMDVLHALNSSDTLLMRDSFDKTPVPTGILAGSLTHLGNWEECVGVRDVSSSPSGRTFHGQMCVVTIAPNKQDNSKREVSLPLETRVEMGKLPDIELRIAFCVPSTCTAKQIQRIFNESLALEDMVAAKIEDRDCTTADKRPLDGHDWAGIGVLSVLAVIVVASTAYDILVPTTRKKPLPAAFSVISNGRKLLAPPRAGGDQSLASIHGIRFLSMIWVVVGHRYMYGMFAPSLNPTFIRNVFDKWYYIGLTNATVSVDTFFVLSGLLLTYLFFKQEPSNRHLNLPMYYIHRYIRLTPALAMMVLVHATFLTRVGNGPLWPAYTNEAREACQKHWWNVLLYVGNYIDPDMACVGQSWYLMVDMQLHWLSPLLLIPIAKWPRIGKFFFLPFIIAGLVISFVISYTRQFTVGRMETTEEKSKEAFSQFYMATYARFVPYVIGMAIGFTLAEEKEKREKQPLTSIEGLFGWLSVAALMLIPLFTYLPFLKPPFPSYLEAALYNSLHRPAWGLGVAGVVYLCANGLGGPVNKLLSWQGFQILGRFSYCIYLTHMTVQTVQIGGIMTSIHLSDREFLMQFAADFVTAFLLAAALSLVCESPFLVLEKELLGGHRKPPSSTPVVVASPSAAFAQQTMKPSLKSPERLV